MVSKLKTCAAYKGEQLLKQDNESLTQAIIADQHNTFTLCLTYFCFNLEKSIY